MSKEIIEEIARVARQIEEQLKFYHEIGITDISDPARALKQAPGAVLVAEPERELDFQEAAETALERPEGLDMPKKKAPVEQAGLFGDIRADDQPAPRKGAALPLLQPQDSSLEAIREDIGECVRCKL